MAQKHVQNEPIKTDSFLYVGKKLVGWFTIYKYYYNTLHLVKNRMNWIKDKIIQNIINLFFKLVFGL